MQRFVVFRIELEAENLAPAAIRSCEGRAALGGTNDALTLVQCWELGSSVNV